MAGLLKRARAIRDRIGTRLSPSRQKNLAEDLSREKEDEVMAEMNAILESNRIQITEETLSYNAQSSGAFFPVLINIAAFAVLALLGVLFIWMFDRSEETITGVRGGVQSAEGRIVEAVRAASQAEIARKEAEISSIQDSLQEARASQAALQAETEAEIARREAALRDSLAAELEAERARLREAGLGEDELERRLSAYEEQRQQELQNNLDALSAELEARRAEQERELTGRIEAINASLATAEAEQARLEADMERRLAEAREGASAAAEEADSERSAALAELERLSRQREQEGLVQDQILTLYDQVNNELSRGDYRQALARLDTLDSYLSQPSVANLPFVEERRDVEGFLIGSLRRLITSEMDGEPSTAAPPAVIAEATRLVEEGNRLYAEGEVEQARTRYAEALEAIPVAAAGYRRIEEIENLTRTRRESAFQTDIDAGTRLYTAGNYSDAIARYRQALGLLDFDDRTADLIVDQLTQAGYRLNRALEPDPEPVVIREELSDEQKALIEQSRAAAARQAEFRRGVERLQEELRLSDAETQTDSREALIALLNTKLLIRQALASDAVRKEYPDLYNKTESVFEAYAELERRDAERTTLEEVIELTRYLAGGAGTDPPALDAAEAARQRELLLQFLSNLEELTAGPAPAGDAGIGDQP